MFGATSTADEVLRATDLNGCRVLVTGVSAGVGAETARVLVSHGAQVVGAARDLVKAQATTAQLAAKAAPNGFFRLIELDLASLASVRACADALLKVREQFDVVIANAGVMATPKGTTVDGFETQFGTNYLGHFVLVNRIAKLFKPGGRLVMVSSAGHRGVDVNLDDPNFQQTAYDPLIPLSLTVDSGVICRGSDGSGWVLSFLMGGHDEWHTVGDRRHAVCGGVAQVWSSGA